MVIINWIVNYRRFLKRRNYSPHTIKNYMHTLRHFVLWLDIPLEEVTNKKVLDYIDFLLDKGLKRSTLIWTVSGVFMSTWATKRMCPCQTQSNGDMPCACPSPFPDT